MKKKTDAQIFNEQQKSSWEKEFKKDDKSFKKKPSMQTIHVHKQKQCWTVHNKDGCFHFDEVQIKVPSWTEHKPLKKENPRYFIRCKGVLSFDGGKAVIE